MAIIYDIHQHDLEMRTRTLSESKPLTGYPSIDKPWLKYYSDKAINMPLPKCTMFQYVYDNNKDYSADIALQYYGKRITYGQLFERIRCAASAFWAMGVRDGDIVTIMSMHTPETIYAIYALNYIGAVANMVYMTLAEKEILRTLDSTESKMLLVLDAALDRILPIKDRLAVPVVILGLADSMPLHMKLCCGLKTGHWKHGFLTWHSFNERGAHEPPMAVDGNALAVIVYASGTTGAPKGVMLSNSEVNALAYQDINGIIGLRRNLVTLFILPPFIGYGYSHLHVGLSAGLVMQLQIDLTPTKVAKELFKNQAECFCAGPAFLDAIMEHSASDFSKLEYFICGGGEISREKEIEVNAFLNKCHSKATYSNGYGMTEASSVLCVNCNKICKESPLAKLGCYEFLFSV